MRVRVQKSKVCKTWLFIYIKQIYISNQICVSQPDAKFVKLGKTTSMYEINIFIQVKLHIMYSDKLMLAFIKLHTGICLIVLSSGVQALQTS